VINCIRVIPERVECSADSKANDSTSHEDAKCEEIMNVSSHVLFADVVVGIYRIKENHYRTNEMRKDVAGLIVQIKEAL